MSEYFHENKPNSQIEEDSNSNHDDQPSVHFGDELESDVEHHQAEQREYLLSDE
eukprot:Awhi_evm1s5308